MPRRVVRLRVKARQIFDAVVVFDAVDVMANLGRQESPAQVSLHHEAMFINIAATILVRVSR